VWKYERLEMPIELFGCVWVVVTQEDSGEHWFFRPREPASPRQD